MEWYHYSDLGGRVRQARNGMWSWDITLRGHLVLTGLGFASEREAQDDLDRAVSEWSAWDDKALEQDVWGCNPVRFLRPGAGAA